LGGRGKVHQNFIAFHEEEGKDVIKDQNEMAVGGWIIPEWWSNRSLRAGSKTAISK